MAQPLAIAPHPLAAETAPTGQGAPVDIGASRSAVKLALELTAISGAGESLVVSIQTSADGVTGWRTVDSWSALTAVDKVQLCAADLSRWVRISWALAGTSPSATFVVSGNAHQLFLQIADVTLSELPAKAITSVPKNVQANALIVASADGETAMASCFTLPIVTMTSVDVMQRLAQIAAYHIMKYRGFQPQGADELIVKAYDDAQAWLLRMSQAKIRPPGITDSAPTVYEGGAAVVTSASRGW